MEQSERDTNALVKEYLRRIRSAAGQLARIERMESEDDDFPALLEQIATSLVQACDISVLSSPTDNLPRRHDVESPLDPPLQEDEEDLDPSYEWRRVDYLRILLRSMAPIAIDVAAHLCTQQPQGGDQQVALFVLFSVWLPVAPHLTPLASGLFRTFSACPLLDQPKSWLLAEAAHHLCQFYCYELRQHGEMVSLWDWSPIFGWCHNNNSNNNNISSDDQVATKWHAVRAVGWILNLSSRSKADFYRKRGVDDTMVRWIPHPWDLQREAKMIQDLFMEGRTIILWSNTEDESFAMPYSSDIRQHVPLHPYLVQVGEGMVFCRHHAVENDVTKTPTQQLVHTATTAQNLMRIGEALACPDHPILVSGPPGSGKSSLIREVARLFASDQQLLEFHVDEETDTKTLVGSYTATDIPGQFEWRPGALTRAVREGRWVMFEELGTVPSEIQASLVSLVQDGLLPLGNGEVERCHPNFRLWATRTQNTSGRILFASSWQTVLIEPLPFEELNDIAAGLHPNFPSAAIGPALQIFQRLDRSGRASEKEDAPTGRSHHWFGRSPSVRDLFKLFSRISQTIAFESGSDYLTEAQRTLCLAETVDVFVASHPDRQEREDFVRRVIAPQWGISSELATRYVCTRSPTVELHAVSTEVGRARIPVAVVSKRQESASFSQTAFALRLIEMAAVCVRQNEPTLLVGETGCGKTTLLQHLARLCGRDLLVQNLSLQTDSTDLLGGFRPLQIEHLARIIHERFVDLFTSTFSRKQNAEFLQFASSAMKKQQWKKLSQFFRRACLQGLNKVKERIKREEAHASNLEAWKEFRDLSDRFEKQRLACDSGMAFAFTEGALVDAIRRGSWVLLDEINLASSETLQRLCGLLDDSQSSITLTERGDSFALQRHPDFRLFAAMNPATDTGKKDLSPNVRSRFTEIYVDELLDPVELRHLAGRYLERVLPASSKPPEHTDLVIAAVEAYLECRRLSQTSLADGNGQRPRYTLRTLTRALLAAKALVLEQKISLTRALVEGMLLAFQGVLDPKSSKLLKKTIFSKVAKDLSSKDMEHPGRRPGQAEDFILMKPFWIKKGPYDTIDWASKTTDGSSPRFILTSSTQTNVRRLVRAIASGPWPILLEGPTSAGKTTLVEYLARRCGHAVVRINNHEHTDIQEYTGGFTADSNGSLGFQDGLLVRALRRGDWVILDELNLAPSDVLEALNRLLDDNRELYLPEVNETVKAHPSFRLFATQNPSGAYGGRKPLSRAFRNRFVEMFVPDIPSAEMVSILHLKCSIPTSHSKQLVSVMEALRHRRSRNSFFQGKDSLITPRDLIRWAKRGSTSKQELAREGYMLLAERLRSDGEKAVVQAEIEAKLGVKIDVEGLYFGEHSEARSLLSKISGKAKGGEHDVDIAPTRSILRLVTLVLRCVKNEEPVLLVGETGCGKTTVVQYLSRAINNTLNVVNCHATTEISDLIGGLRPVRGRSSVTENIVDTLRDIFRDFRRWVADVNTPVSIAGLMDEDVMEVDGLTATEVSTVVTFARDLVKKAKQKHAVMNGPDVKRRKLNQECNSSVESSPSSSSATFPSIFADLEGLLRRHYSLFEWVDGPLVDAMKRGEMVLLDEMSLAEDAVLERLNSVLEPSRTIVLAEKGSSDMQHDVSVIAHKDFRIFATMNPGGDFGKRELSPALRSRFTEIWVPPITEREDIKLVLDHSLSQSLQDMTADLVSRYLLDYIEWFNTRVCQDAHSQLTEFTLSLRDMLTWTTFIVAMSKTSKLALDEILVHGARMMHLDGLGLGTGNILPADVALLKKAAEGQILSKFEKHNPVHANESQNIPLIQCADRLFNANPFRITIGPKPLVKPPFSFDAKTPAINTQRVIRSMQLSKPILLEGSPGVGKTTLVAAIAEASGHNLTRINLSEQTDIADLMGTDLPALDSSESDGRPSFKWRDGVLLTAIKNGDWVLLDELNLAPQSVLEGLNSCLDHRASVFIPELGKSFKCPPSFRVFAAQNPLAQGGGRKGLPKSFLNRFSKVYVDELSEDDMTYICGSAFPHISSESMRKLVRLNCKLQALTAKGVIGSSGSPWEFNLRDIFRLCRGLDKDLSNLDVLMSDIYFQRFRETADRRAARELCSEYFQCLSREETPENVLSIDAMTVQIHDVVLQRASGEIGSRIDSEYKDGIVVPTQTRSLRAIGRCVAMNWPCLLVENTSDGETSLIRYLAELAGVNLIEVALSSSSDVSELVGSFEQASTVEPLQQAIEKLETFTLEVLMEIDDDVETCRISEAAFNLRKARSESRNALEDRSKLALQLVEELRRVKVENITTIDSLLPVFKSFANKKESSLKSSTSFVWKDGPLVRAMKEGHWLHLRNANLCPSSVLDRLNPVMEPNGSLFLAEGGSDGGSASREIFGLASFRIFLSMDPNFGEVSRAMRNRCVEIALPHVPQAASFVKRLNVYKHIGVQSSSVIQGIHSFENDTQDSHIIMQSMARLQRGCALMSSSSRASTGFRECGPYESLVPFALGMDVFPVRMDLSVSPEQTSLRMLARALNPNMYCKNLTELSEFADDKGLSELLGFTTVRQSGEIMRYHLIATYILNAIQGSRGKGQHFLSSMCCSLKRTARWMQRRIQEDYGESRLIERMDGWKFTLRLPHQLKTHLWELQMQSSKSFPADCFHELSILDLAYLVSNGNIDENRLHCRAVPALLPFFHALDIWIQEQLETYETEKSTLLDVADVMVERDGLWEVLATTRVAENRHHRHLCFEPSDLIVQWRWLQKRIIRMETRAIEDSEAWIAFANISSELQKAVFDSNQTSMVTPSSLKWPTIALFPRTEADWIEHMVMMAGASSMSISFDSFDNSMEKLLESNHPILFVDFNLKQRILAGWSTQQVSRLHDLAPTTVASLNGLGDAIARELQQRKASFSKGMESVYVDHNACDTSQLLGDDGLPRPDIVVEGIFRSFTKNLLMRFSQIQVAPIAESICEKLETKIIRSVSQVLCDPRESSNRRAGFLSTLPTIKRLLSTALEYSTWSVRELLPYQSVLWLVEADVSTESLLKLVPALLTTMLYNLAARSTDGRVRASWPSSLGLPPLVEEATSKLAPKNAGAEDPSCVFQYCIQLLGGFFQHASSNYDFASIEGFGCRVHQAHALRRLFAFQEQTPTDLPHELLFLLSDTINVLSKKLQNIDPERLVDCMKQAVSLGQEKKDSLLIVCRQSTDVRLVECVESIVSPLLDHLHIIWTKASRSSPVTHEYGVSWVLLGLLRFRLSVPVSPADPGSKALSKIKLLDRKVKSVKSHICARQLNTWCVEGEIRGDGAQESMLEECASLEAKSGIQCERVIRRPVERPNFSELFSETNSFTKSVLREDAVLDLLDSATKPSTSRRREHSRLRITQFQSTSRSFCNMMNERFGVYEDVVSPIVGSVALMQRGFDNITQWLLESNDSGEVDYVTRCLLPFPFRFEERDGEISYGRPTQALGRIDGALLLSILSRLRIDAAIWGLDESMLRLWLKTIEELNPNESSDDAPVSEPINSEEIEERAFREQFPDHTKGFMDAFQENDVDLDAPPQVEATSKLPKCDQSITPRNKIPLLCDLHGNLFGGNMSQLNDTDRLHTFGLCFAAATSVLNTPGCKHRRNTDFEGVSGLSFAFSLATNSDVWNGSLPSSNGRKFIDFGKDPNPKEVLRAWEPLDSLTARLMQLLSFYPGNVVLGSLLRVVERIRKLDIHHSAWGKVMAGLELIVKHAQDWEEHASSRVKLGAPLVAINQLASQWRKAELASWRTLLQSREERMQTCAKQHWINLHLTLKSCREKLKGQDGKSKQNVCPSTPIWIRNGGCTSSPLSIADVLLEEMKLLDTFCLSSPLGEFSTRLKLLRNFCRQFDFEHGVGGGPCEREEKLGSFLKTLCLYYGQFLPSALQKIAEMRSPIESKLDNEVKLAKWDDKTYFAQATATDRNRRTLMKFLREYDEALELPVSSVVESQLSRGIRNPDQPDQACAAVPALSDIFPFTVEKITQHREFAGSGRGFGELSTHAMSAKVQQWCKKIDKMFSQYDVQELYDGHDMAEGLCDAIFERIQALKDKQSPRPMKERALTDLLRELKRHGYVTTGWSLPTELKGLDNVFQVPTQNTTITERADKYYLRSLAELSRFEAELKQHGTRHLTARQTSWMLAIAHHGTLQLLQQRCTFSSSLYCRDKLSEMASLAVALRARRTCQKTATRSLFRRIKRTTKAAKESTSELRLSISFSLHLLQEEEQQAWARDAIARLQAFSELKPIPSAAELKALITDADVEKVDEDRRQMKSIRECLTELRKQSSKLECLPAEIWEEPERLCNTALALIESFESETEKKPVLSSDSSDEERMKALDEAISKCMGKVLVCVQTLVKPNDEADASEDTIWCSHRKFVESRFPTHIEDLYKAFCLCLERFHLLEEFSFDVDRRTEYFASLNNMSSLVLRSLRIIDNYLRAAATFNESCSKLQYILLRVFRVLVAKGFCSDNAKDESDDEEGGGQKGDFADDQDGTGMGEGEGSNDVTDEIENEEQLLGLKGDQDNDAKGEQPKELSKEEAAKGMEMEGDFEGEMHDVPQEEEGDDGDDDDDKEELDQEMNDAGDDGGDVVDEKLWGESDTEEDGQEDEGRFEKDSGVEGDGAGDEMMTRDEDDKKSKEGEQENQIENDAKKQGAEEEMKEDGDNENNDINEDLEDNYEESHGIDVRRESIEDDDEEDKDGGEEMELEDNLSIDDGKDDTNDPEDDENAAGNDEDPVEKEEEKEHDAEDARSEGSEENDPESQMDSCHVAGEDEDNPAPDDPTNTTDARQQQSEPKSGLGVQSKDGVDTVEADPQEEIETEQDTNAADEAGGVDDENDQNKSDNPGGGGSGEKGQQTSHGQDGSQQMQSKGEEIPNPLKDPGDAMKYWHEKVNILNSNDGTEDMDMNEDDENQTTDDGGNFEFVTEQQNSTTQALGDVDDQDEMQVDPREEDEENNDKIQRQNADESSKPEKDKATTKEAVQSTAPKSSSSDEKSGNQKPDSTNETSEDGIDEGDSHDEHDEREEGSINSNDDDQEENERENTIVSDLTMLNSSTMEESARKKLIEVDGEQKAGISTAEMSQARSRWVAIQADTHTLSRRLCEKLRLVMEPLVASKLRGDYRTGKRINMKRVISYIASGYRKDKIWMRRTKPAKRNYRVLLAVDDSESMLKSGAGDTALRAMATLANGMSQLEIGEIGVASFGEEMKLVHPFQTPFTSESGVQVVKEFQFDQKRTRTALCVESARMALENSGDVASMQLVFIISDGRIERDSKDSLRRLIREMMEENILIAMIIVEGERNKHSILNMKEVTFEKGKPNVKQFIADYPFPYYIILEDMQTLPEVLGDVLRQWFEMLARLQSDSSN